MSKPRVEVELTGNESTGLFTTFNRQLLLLTLASWQFAE
jgi:hypothetical protein